MGNSLFLMEIEAGRSRRPRTTTHTGCGRCRHRSVMVQRSSAGLMSSRKWGERSCSRQGILQSFLAATCGHSDVQSAALALRMRAAGGNEAHLHQVSRCKFHPFASKIMDLSLTMMNFVLKMMNSALKIMNFVCKMMNFKRSRRTSALR